VAREAVTAHDGAPSARQGGSASERGGGARDAIDVGRPDPGRVARAPDPRKRVRRVAGGDDHNVRPRLPRQRTRGTHSPNPQRSLSENSAVPRRCGVDLDRQAPAFSPHLVMFPAPLVAQKGNALIC
jgi:hypothetical protein